MCASIESEALHDLPHVDLDDESSWPSHLWEVANGRPFEYDAEDWRVLLENRPLRTYHATRLLPHEFETIRSQGLRASSANLLEGRISEALQLGYITQRQAVDFRRQDAFARGKSENRVGRVCSILGRAPLRCQGGIEGLIGCWGGEVLHRHDRDVQSVVSKIGDPALVVLDHPMQRGVKTLLSSDLVTIFRDALREPNRHGADVINHGDVPSWAVVDVVDVRSALRAGRFPELAWLA